MLCVYIRVLLNTTGPLIYPVFPHTYSVTLHWFYICIISQIYMYINYWKKIKMIDAKIQDSGYLESENNDRTSK